ncbi:MAG: hypothetical protein HZA01_01875 [Nitrospinae bacterium]|nr:hypothetical protein [Nitrospinota bacterium]
MPRARAKQTISSKVSNISSTFEKRIGYMQEANTIPVFNGDILAEFRENWKK